MTTMMPLQVVSESMDSQDLFSSQPILSVCQSELTEFFFAELTEFAVKLSEAQ